MCGIAGFWNLNNQPVDEAELHRFTDSISHRGPDGNGFYIDASANLGLGHRRLAILDTSDSGKQPMPFANQRYWIIFNGEIYNFIELKSELETAGFTFRTESDTEVLLAAYHHWGEDFQLKLNGMWAFAIWDSAEKKLFLSRDRFGVKPLIYFYNENRFAFASEMKAFLALDSFNLEFDPAMITQALTNQRLIEGDERCLIKGLNHLLGGHCLTLQKGEKPKIRRWWNTLDHLQEVPQTYTEQTEYFKELFLDACRIRMRSDVPIGTALSGGLDSSAIVSGMNYIHQKNTTTDRLAASWQKAFIMTYPGAEIDEKKYADEVIKHTGVMPHYSIGDSSLYLKHYNDILFQYEEISDIHLGPWLIHKSQREHGVVVTLDGHGGDEILAGYPWYITAAIKDSISSLAPIRTLKLISMMYGLGVINLNALYAKLKNKKNTWLLQTPTNFISSAYEQDMPRIKNRDQLFKTLYTDFHYTQLPTNLRDFDRLSMAHGVEVRAPFMDWRLVCYLFSLPSSVKIGDRFTKQILRDSLKGILPESIRTRTRKLGFPNLAEAWTSPQAIAFMQDVIHSQPFQESQIWNGKQIQRDFVLATQSKNEQTLHQIWIYVQAFSLMKLFQEKQRTYK
ncbi:MAG: asparagine synthase (glutamine-hydrolyzing) [Anaerolineales bacterium]|nr:asparagine synthase (glutamine-hydrolyzing) [Anaerolineales bacterium]